MRRSSGETPLLAVQVLAGGDGVDGTALSFLVQRAVEDRKREKEEKEKEKARKKKEAQEKADLELAKRDRWWAQHLADMKAMEERRNKASSSSKRKRKKRRKRRMPRTSSLPGRARRRLRQWFACSAGFTGDGVPRVMFPSGVVRPKMLCIMAGMVQKDSCSGIARLVLLMTVHLVLCFLPSLQARDARHHGQHGPEGLVCWFLVKVFYVPVVVLRVVSWSSRSCSSSRSSLPVDTQRQIPMVLAVQMTISIPQLQLIDNSADVLVVHVGQVPQVQVVFLTFVPSSWCRSWRRQSSFLLPRDPQDKSLTCPLLSTTDARWFRQCRKLWSFMALTIKISRLQYSSRDPTVAGRRAFLTLWRWR